MNENTGNKEYTEPAAQPEIFGPACCSMVLLWLSAPPIGIAWLAWLALIPIVWVTLQEPSFSRSHYWKIWFAGVLYWLATFYFIPIPHPALWLGWIVISLYLACYLPLFVLSVRSLHANFRIPNLFAVPICWTGMELIRCYLLTGMGLVCLSHTQYRNPVWIQVSDLFGAYTLTFVIAMVAVGCVRLLRFREGKPVEAIVNVAIALCFVVATFMYGQYRLDEQTAKSAQAISVGLIQGSIDTVFPDSAEADNEYRRGIAEHYENLTVRALSEWPHVDLLVWPENGWQQPDLHPDTDTSLLDEQQAYFYDVAPQIAWSRLMRAAKTPPQVLVGALTVDPGRMEMRGSVLHFDDTGKVADRYYKNHLVMFGEYVPLADVFPLLQRIPAIGKGLQAGEESVTVDVKGVRIAPSICFESTVPHYIRGQVNGLARQNNEPDVLVNITNDGWFYGTSCLDFHLACNVFRAVEMRKPVLVCANTGISAHVDDRGRILDECPRRKTGKILAQVVPGDASSLYRVVGDWVAIGLAALALMAAVIEMFKAARIARWET